MKKQSSLIQAVLSSSIFLTFFISSSSNCVAFTPVVDGGNSTTTPSASGYNFDSGGTQTFNISHNDAITNTGGVSFDHNPATGVATLNFQGSANVSGSMGDYPTLRSINLINLNTNNQANAEVRVQTGNIVSGTVNFNNDAALVLEQDGQIARINITTSTANSGVVQFLEGGKIGGTTGTSIMPIKKLDFVNQSGGRVLTLRRTLNANDVAIASDGLLIVQDGIALTNQVNFTGDGTLQILDAINGTITNGMVTQNHQQGNLLFSGNSTFSSDLGQNTKSLNTISVGATGAEVQLAAKQIYAKNMTFIGDGKLTLNGIGPINVFAAINPSLNNQGEINITATNAVTFKIASGQTQTIRLFTASSDAVIEADFKATQTNITNGKTLNINKNIKFESAIDGAAPGVGSVVYDGVNSSYGEMGATRSLALVSMNGTSGIFTLQNNIRATQTTVNNQQVLLLDNAANHSITGNLILNNTAQLIIPIGKTLQLLGTGNVSLNNNTMLHYDMADKVTGLVPAIISTGRMTLSAGSKINLISAPKIAAVPFGKTTITLIRDSSGAVPVEPILIGGENCLFLNTKISTSASELNLELIRTPIKEITMQPHLLGISSVFDNIIGQSGLSGELLGLSQQLDNINDLTKFRDQLASVTPIVDSSTSQTVQTTQQDVFGLVAQRMDDIRAQNHWSSEGYAAGYINKKYHGAWVKGFANYSEQDSRDLINGFDATTKGLAIGGDTFISERSLIGLSLAFASSRIHHDLNQARTEIEYYQGSIYGDVNLSNPMFINWMVAATYLNYDQNRTIRLNNASVPVKADYHGWQYGARTEIGYAFGKLSFHTVPTLALTYSHLGIEEYTERGAGTASQKVSPSAQDNLQAEFGVKLVNNIVAHELLTQPELHAKIRYELFENQQKTSSQFVSIGPSYDTIGYFPTKESYNAGTSLTIFGEGGFVFSVSYDYDFRNDYRAHTGFVRLRYEW